MKERLAGTRVILLFPLFLLLFSRVNPVSCSNANDFQGFYFCSMGANSRDSTVVITIKKKFGWSKAFTASV